VIRAPTALPRIVLHELVHANQHYGKVDSLLAECVKEGICDFVVTLLLGPHDSTHYTYGRQNETALWERFAKEMDTQNYSNWLCEGTNAKDRPADLGYFIGHQICAAYFAARGDVPAAVGEMLHVTDFRAFLSESQYEGSAAVYTAII
jgi:uncharacterized protein YjaZ